MTDYETGRKARREGEPLQSNPYLWSWFRRYAWERGWYDEERYELTHAAIRHHCQGSRGSQTHDVLRDPQHARS